MNDFYVFVMVPGGLYKLIQIQALTEEKALAKQSEADGEDFTGVIGKAFLHKRDRTVVRRTEFAVVN